MDTIQSLKLTSLYELPVLVTNPTKKLVEHYVYIALSQLEQLPLVDVGLVRGKHYVIGNDSVYRACKKISLNEIKVSVTPFDTITDALIQHVRKNKDPSSFDPLLLRNAVDYLAEKGINEDAAINLFLLHNTPAEKILRLPLTEDAVKRLEKLTVTLAEKLTFVSMPVYILSKISKIDQAKQVAAAESVEALILLESISDARFAWPNPEVIDDVLHEFIHTVKKSQNLIVAQKVYDSSDITKTAKVRFVPQGTNSTDVQLIKTMSNVIYITQSKDNKPLIVDTKTHRVAPIKNNDTCISLVGDLGTRTFLFPESAVKHLDLENDNNNNNIHMKKFDSISELQKIIITAKKKKIKTSGVLFSTDKL